MVEDVAAKPNEFAVGMVEKEGEDEQGAAVSSITVTIIQRRPGLAATQFPVRGLRGAYKLFQGARP